MAELIAARAISGAVGGLLLLCIKIYDKRKRVQRFEKDCDKLLDFVRRIQSILETTAATADVRQPGWLDAFEALDSALRGVDTVFEHCSKYGLIKSIMNADDMNMRLSNIAQQLQSALLMIPIQQGNMTAAKLEELRELQLDLKHAQWAATRAAEQQAAELKRLSDQSAVDAGKTHEMLTQVLSLLKADAAGSACRGSSRAQGSAGGGPGVQHEQLEAEKQELQEWLLDFKQDKCEHEERYVQQIIQMIEWLEAAEASGADTRPRPDAATAAAVGHKSRRPSEAQAGPPSNLKCPITLQLFVEPVLLVGSGHTYEKAAIEEWLSRGNKKDPVSGTVLQCTTTAPNITVRKCAQDWLEENPWWTPGHGSTQQQQQQQPLLGTAAGTASNMQQLLQLRLNATQPIQQQSLQQQGPGPGIDPSRPSPGPLLQPHPVYPPLLQQAPYYPFIQPVSAPVLLDRYSGGGEVQPQAGFSSQAAQATSQKPAQPQNPATQRSGSAPAVNVHSGASQAAEVAGVAGGMASGEWSMKSPSAPPLAPFPAAAGSSAGLHPAHRLHAGAASYLAMNGLQVGPVGPVAGADSAFERTAATTTAAAASGLRAESDATCGCT